jgi:hypothetical protein
MQLAWNLEALRAPKCADGGDVHVVAPCGHCGRCGVPLLTIVGELAGLCPGHGSVAA